MKYHVVATRGWCSHPGPGNGIGEDKGVINKKLMVRNFGKLTLPNLTVSSIRSVHFHKLVQQPNPEVDSPAGRFPYRWIAPVVGQSDKEKAFSSPQMSSVLGGTATPGGPKPCKSAGAAALHRRVASERLSMQRRHSSHQIKHLNNYCLICCCGRGACGLIRSRTERETDVGAARSSLLIVRPPGPQVTPTILETSQTRA